MRVGRWYQDCPPGEEGISISKEWPEMNPDNFIDLAFITYDKKECFRKSVEILKSSNVTGLGDRILSSGQTIK